MNSREFDTSHILTWIQEHCETQIVNFSADLDQNMEDPAFFKTIEANWTVETYRFNLSE
jgi:argininosuccinate synthase